MVIGITERCVEGGGHVEVFPAPTVSISFSAVRRPSKAWCATWQLNTDFVAWSLDSMAR